MQCYFPGSELRCPGDVDEARIGSIAGKLYRSRGRISIACQPVLDRENASIPDLRAAGIEYLFSHVSEDVVREAERQLNSVFTEPVPNDLITVQIRWGDKTAEMKLVPISQYIEAVESILRERGRSLDEANIFLATEDPDAYGQFLNASRPGWNIFVDQYLKEMLPHRRPEYNGNPKMSKQLDGAPGLVALGSLLLSVEANDFVLTTKSNWSRLMNELRKNIVDPRCNGCTKMVDLSQGEWRR
jgi:hypothetical protein